MNTAATVSAGIRTADSTVDSSDYTAGMAPSAARTGSGARWPRSPAAAVGGSVVVCEGPRLRCVVPRLPCAVADGRRDRSRSVPRSRADVTGR
jgi:hypothetical protein